MPTRQVSASSGRTPNEINGYPYLAHDSARRVSFMAITGDMKIHELIEHYPHMREWLVAYSPEF